ncbi:MAG TPA: porin [Burkholderiales bacterium]|nr:porin [Burkholderiales bacterium]
MKKKAVALAVGALFAAPAVHAQISLGNETIGTVQIYGKLYPQFIVAKGQGSTQPGTGVSTLVSANGVLGGAAVQDHGQRNAIDSQNSYLGFRGERSLGGSLKGIWQLEQAIEIDTGTGTFSSRNSFAGLSHGTLGTVKLGKMDTIYKEYGDTFSMFGISSGNFVSASNVLSTIGIGNNNVARFHERWNNTIQYQTAEFGGFQAGIQYMPDETRGDPGRGINTNGWSYGVKWDSQMFYASIHQEIHNDAFGASANIPDATIANSTAAGGNTRSRDMATRVSGEIRLGASHRIVGDIARLHYSETGQVATGRFQDYKKPTWAIGYDAGVGAWRFATQYIRAGSGTCQLTGGVDCSTTGLDAWMWTLGARYRFDRQTFVYVIAAKLANGNSARMDNWAASSPNRGEDVKQAAIGVSYSF